MAIDVRFKVRQTADGWTYDLWTQRIGWLPGCGDCATEKEANYSAPRAADILAIEVAAADEAAFWHGDN